MEFPGRQYIYLETKPVEFCWGAITPFKLQIKKRVAHI